MCSDNEVFNTNDSRYGLDRHRAMYRWSCSRKTVRPSNGSILVQKHQGKGRVEMLEYLPVQDHHDDLYSDKINYLKSGRIFEKVLDFLAIAAECLLYFCSSSCNYKVEAMISYCPSIDLTLTRLDNTCLVLQVAVKFQKAYSSKILQ